MMALKMLYRGPSSRLENLIEKIQATKEIVNTGKYNCTYIYRNLHIICKSTFYNILKRFLLICK